MTSDAWVNDVRAKLKAIKGPGPDTVCLVYMTEQHDGGQASYCEVFDKEATAVKSLLSRGFKCRGGSFPEEYRIDFCDAYVAANVKVKTDDA